MQLLRVGHGHTLFKNLFRSRRRFPALSTVSSPPTASADTVASPFDSGAPSSRVVYQARVAHPPPIQSARRNIKPSPLADENDCVPRKRNRSPRPTTNAKRQGPHPRNSFQGTYDMDRLSSAYSPLASFVAPPFARSERQKLPTVDFTDPSAVRALNTALLVADYGIDPSFAEALPKDALFPTVPGRADYVHYVADVLMNVSGIADFPPTGSKVRGLDIGTGASCIYPLVAASCYGWSMAASEVIPASIESAMGLVSTNGRADLVDIRRQNSSASVFDGVWKTGEEFDFTICNPPFYPSLEAVRSENLRKRKGLARGGANRERVPGKGGIRRRMAPAPATNGCVKDDSPSSDNFGASAPELWCDGGELTFVRRMIEESRRYADRCLVFTTMVSRKENLRRLERDILKDNNGETGFAPAFVRTMPMGAGSKSASILIWSFLHPKQREEWAKRRKWA